MATIVNAEVIGRVDSERIYKHVLKLEGPRHPIDAPQKLDEAADYILSALKECGLTVKSQEFQVEGSDATFRNVEAAIGNGQDPELLIVSHYDTVRDCPGADDNGSGIAVMLESARVLTQQEGGNNVRFVSFTLEELNPARELKARRLARSLGLTDERNRYTTARTHRMMKQFNELVTKNLASGKNLSESLAKSRRQLEDQMKESEIEYVRGIEEMSKGITSAFGPGITSLIGSSFWVKEAIKARKELMGVLCLETVGCASNKKNSQFIPEGMDPSLFQTYNVSDINVGNFLAVIGDANSEDIAESFFSQCKLDSVALPCACLQVPLRFSDIAQSGLYNLLRSDHAPFWREGIPALLLTDTANFRYPHYHTQADTIDKLDFAFMTKVCKATIAAASELT